MPPDAVYVKAVTAASWPGVAAMPALERPWLDACLLAVAAGLWGFLVMSQFR